MSSLYLLFLCNASLAKYTTNACPFEHGPSIDLYWVSDQPDYFVPSSQTFANVSESDRQLFSGHILLNALHKLLIDKFYFENNRE